ncbi:hypothetical protein Pedsa_2780 [Pseudopedobacter saltans DSM 12145]|uniref:YtxH domain-containing protein n=1 Tax=Pseudopedobacter saltans (strain ATCC 51119 / DSM 12145 / JCM 21818 / CCUG 39354 / LMG 10337 / NBRC 100064 / NCIMB 13643) TaxID=762903 RepID=F0S7R6_PSESL|nr:YtxH domain-containing protein [Pseudopedobacter saltans]ADY53321.1 hypothetical protein Pedsa_2780 [Pseudopedobacter saltans DSM 12145]
MNENTKTAIALLAGLAAGAALGLLFAPEKGSDTRDKLSDSLKNLGDSIREKAAEEIDNLSELKEKIVNNIRTKVKQAEADLEEDMTGV